jgi:hypothetical protein
MMPPRHLRRPPIKPIPGQRIVGFSPLTGGPIYSGPSFNAAGPVMTGALAPLREVAPLNAPPLDVDLTDGKGR